MCTHMYLPRIRMYTHSPRLATAYPASRVFTRVVTTIPAKKFWLFQHLIRCEFPDFICATRAPSLLQGCDPGRRLGGRTQTAQCPSPPRGGGRWNSLGRKPSHTLSRPRQPDLPGCVLAPALPLGVTPLLSPERRLSFAPAPWTGVSLLRTLPRMPRGWFVIHRRIKCRLHTQRALGAPCQGVLAGGPPLPPEPQVGSPALPPAEPLSLLPSVRASALPLTSFAMLEVK